MSVKNLNRRSASLDNQMATFLVKFCNEEPHLSEVASTLFDTYIRNYGECTNSSDFYRRSMSREAFIARLKGVGFAHEVVSSPDNRKFTVFHGLGLQDQEDAKSCRLTRNIPRTVTSAATAAASVRSMPPIPQRIRSTELSALAASGGSSVTHVSVNGVVYERGLISTVRPITAFRKHTGQICTHIVTFHNPEMRHQFLTEEEAARLKAQLQRIAVG